jgi:crossover junction endodeoxyribonuclease RuvC
MIIGVDPGAKGAIVVVERAALHYLDLERCVVGRRLEPAPIRAFLYYYAPHIKLAVLEDPQSMPGEGHVGAFSFGRTCGVLHGLLVGLGVPVRLVTPGVWKGSLGLTRDKTLCRKRAMELYPLHAGLFKRVKDDGRAEAALMAFFGQRFVAGEECPL